MSQSEKTRKEFNRLLRLKFDDLERLLQAVKEEEKTSSDRILKNEKIIRSFFRELDSSKIVQSIVLLDSSSNFEKGRIIVSPDGRSIMRTNRIVSLSGPVSSDHGVSIEVFYKFHRYPRTTKKILMKTLQVLTGVQSQIVEAFTK